MRKTLLIAVALAGFAAAPGPAVAADPLSDMFRWWNRAITEPDGFSERAFARYFTDDSTLAIDGRIVARGMPALARHFQAIQASGALVEIVLPFKEAFQRGNKVYTYHIIRSRRNGVPSCLLAAGHAVVRGRRIASISLVRTKLEPNSEAFDPSCWRT
jgi:hypothetical protein